MDLVFAPKEIETWPIDRLREVVRFVCTGSGRFSRAPRFLRLFSAGAWFERFEVGSGLLTCRLAGGFVAVVQSLRLDPRCPAA